MSVGTSVLQMEHMFVCVCKGAKDREREKDFVFLCVIVGACVCDHNLYYCSEDYVRVCIGTF